MSSYFQIFVEGLHSRQVKIIDQSPKRGGNSREYLKDLLDSWIGVQVICQEQLASIYDI